MTWSARHAVYWVPARDHPLWSAGCAWLGRDPEDPARSSPVREGTREPRRYGFHATLKAPMRLRDGVQEVEFHAAVRAVATTSKPFAMPPLEVAMFARFVALRPTFPIEPGHPLRVLADRCAVELDAFRAPFDDRERARRTRGLDAAEREQVETLGYLHVLDRWRFHMTLSDPLDPAAAEAKLLCDAARHFEEALRAPLTASAIAVFVERRRDEPFSLIHRFALDG